MSQPPAKVNAALQGQESQEARALVADQRKIKSKKDALRKLTAKLKNATLEEDKDALTSEIAETQREIAVLEGRCGAGGPAAAPAAEAAVKPTASTPATAAGEKGVAQASCEKQMVAVARSRDKTLSDVGGEGNAPPRSVIADVASPPAKTGTAPVVHQRGAAGPTNSKPTPPPVAAAGTAQPPTAATGGTKAATASPVSIVAEPVPYSKTIHHRIAELGLLMQNMQLVGGNARTIALLDAYREVARTAPVLNVATLTKVERSQFQKILKENFQFLSLCREPCAGMTHVHRTLERRLAFESDSSGGAARTVSSTADFALPASPVTNVAPSAFHSRSLPASSSRFNIEPLMMPTDTTQTTEDGDAAFVGPREHVSSIIDEIREEIFRSIHSVVEERAQPYVSSGDVILTYGRSSTVELVLQHAAAMNKQFHVIVVDSGPLFEGKSFALRLQRMGLEVTYGLVTAVCTLLPKCTRVLIGASSILQSGEVYSRSGTAVVAAAAKAFRKPVLCLCESHKFISKVWIGSLVQNSEVRDITARHPYGSAPCLDSSARPPAAAKLDPSGYLYDLTPASFVDVVVCEMGCLHPSAIAAAIRDRQDRELLLWQQSP